ncbi:efflux transporter outer membrane subunit [Alteraurantiacibacter aquimixticola]|uniref:Efflux transporter outer membrane subunit n=1 Tax=Alteraurantiacibacter aquimixticola TaxID=2489173 RepID=A0A4T3F5B0_9SPHN|nr:efflux transporter outer membrane subunit [Alteraurantiacibacter aquimixticola]TIX51669.1 efflux transporter outer membrane subunit [Alteraurantiacibacter aquimixticola]
MVFRRSNSPAGRGAQFVRALACIAWISLGGCALQPPYQRPADPVPTTWHNPVEADASALQLDRDGWWMLLEDPAIDELVAAGLRDNPSLAEAAARVDRARAALSAADAGKVPNIGYEGGVSGSGNAGSAGNPDQLSASAGLRLSWEIDLWGRVRENAAAARHRLAARNADAEAARLALIAEIADTALALRACNLTLVLRDHDIASRETELVIARARLGFGAIAPGAVAGIESNLATARTDRIMQEESCRYRLNALVALSGLDAPTIEKGFAPERQWIANEGAASSLLSDGMPRPPAFAPGLPATVLLHHPAVVAAEREAAARWSEIAVARAERLPRLDLAALLTGQWLRVAGAGDVFANATGGASIAGPLFDGGAGTAAVSGAEADYREAVAQLLGATRSAARDVEDALAARQSAGARRTTTSDAASAARLALRADEARWRAGAIARYELEESRRQFIRARESTLIAAADDARAWVALVRASGPVSDAGSAEGGRAISMNRTMDQ